MNSYIKNTLAIAFIVFIAGSLYALTLRGVSGNPNPATVREQFHSENVPMEQRGRFAHVLALGEYGTYELPRVLAEFASPDVGYYEDKFYSFFAPGVSYMAMPLYNLGKQYDLSQVFTFALVSIVSIGAMIFIFLICRQIFELPIWASIAAPIFFAFGSSAWSYAITLYQHHFTVFFFLAGFYSAWRYGRDTKFSWAWGFIPWIAYAAAFTVDYPNPLFLLPMMIYFFLQAWKIHRGENIWRIGFRPSFILVSIGFFAITAWHLNFNIVHFGGWQKLAGGITSYRDLDVDSVINKKDNNSTTIVMPTELAPTYSNAIQETATSTIFTTITILNTTATTTTYVSSTEIVAKELIPKEKNVIGFFTEKRLPYGGYILFVSSERGLLIFWPLIIPALFGVHAAFKKYKAEVSALCGGVLANMFLYFSWGDPWGGWAFGPRYMILSIGILSIFVSYWMADRALLWKRSSVYLLFMYSSAVALLGALTTNEVPPKIEAVPLGVDFTYFRNIEFLVNNWSASYVFNTYADLYISLIQYWLSIYIALIVVMAFIIFLMPQFKNDD